MAHSGSAAYKPPNYQHDGNYGLPDTYNVHNKTQSLLPYQDKLEENEYAYVEDVVIQAQKQFGPSNPMNTLPLNTGHAGELSPNGRLPVHAQCQPAQCYTQEGISNSLGCPNMDPVYGLGNPHLCNKTRMVTDPREMGRSSNSVQRHLPK